MELGIDNNEEKHKERIENFKKETGLPLPPEPVLTRWCTLR